MTKLLPKSIIYLVCSALLLTSCFSKYRTTTREVRKHYANLTHPKVGVFKNDTLQLHYASTGADTLPMLLLIHGAPGGWWGYMNMLDDTTLQKHFHIVSVSRLGYGKSRLKHQRAVTSIETQAKSLINILEANHSSEPIIVLGRSYGAPIAAQLASMIPDQVKQLVLVSPVIDPEKERFYWFSKLGKNRFIQLFLPKEFNIATEEKYVHAEELRKTLPIWGKLTMPVAVLQGEEDWIGDPVNIDFARKRIGSNQSQYITIAKAGHMLTFSHLNMIKELIVNTSRYKKKTIGINLASGK
jgi:pimeloyl-ACP methyl ester carboxylesterase